jgi:hypothetical protein
VQEAIFLQLLGSSQNGMRSFFMPTIEQRAYSDDDQMQSIERAFQRQGKIVPYDVFFDTYEYGKLLPLKQKIRCPKKEKSTGWVYQFNLETAW